MYTYQQICDVKANGGTGRDVAELLGIEYPAGKSTVDEDLYLITVGNRKAREAAEEVAAGNGHGLYGSKRKSNGNGGNGSNGKKAVDPLFTISDEEIVMAARLACKKAGIVPSGYEIRDGIEAGNDILVRFLKLNLSAEQFETLAKTVGVKTEEERRLARKLALVSDIRSTVAKADRLYRCQQELEDNGYITVAPAWIARCCDIDLRALEERGMESVMEIAARVQSPAWLKHLKSVTVMATIR